MKKNIHRYRVTWKGNDYIYTGHDAEEAIRKLANRKVYGKPIMFNYVISLYSAPDKWNREGEEWVTGWSVDGINKEYSIKSILIN